MMINLSNNPRYFLAGVLLFGLIVLTTYAYLCTTWYQDWQLAHQAPKAPAKTDSDANARLIASIPNQHLFGVSATGDMPVTNLELRVTGIVRQVNKQNENISKAYISIAGSPSKIYQVGDTLPDGVKIYEITTDTVILENGGQLEKLPLPREKLEFKSRDPEENF